MRQQYSRRRRLDPRLRWAILLLLGAAAAGLGLIYSMAAYLPPPPPAITPERVQTATAGLRRQMAELRHIRASSPAPVPCTIRVDGDDVSAFVAAHLAASAGSLPSGIENVRDVRISFDSGRIVVTGYVTAWGRQAYVTAAVNVLPDGSGGVSVQPGEMLVGKLPMPSRLRKEIVGRVEEDLRRAVTSAGVSIKSIEMSRGAIVLHGTTEAR